MRNVSGEKTNTVPKSADTADYADYAYSGYILPKHMKKSKFLARKKQIFLIVFVDGNWMKSGKKIG